MGYEFSTTSLASDPNLVSYYKLEDVNDTTASAHNLTNVGTTPFNAALYNNGADFGASNSTKYLHIADNEGITGGAVTLAGWFKLYATTGCYPLVMVGCGASQYVNYFIYYDGNNTFGAGSGVVVANRQKQLVANNIVSSAQSPGTTDFQHYALTYDTTTLTLYYNGSSVGTPLACSGNGSGTASNTFRIGHNNGQSGTLFASAIGDDVVIFNRALTSTEVLLVYTGTAPAPIPNVSVNYIKARYRSRLDLSPISLG